MAIEVETLEYLEETIREAAVLYAAATIVTGRSGLLHKTMSEFLSVYDISIGLAKAG